MKKCTFAGFVGMWAAAMMLLPTAAEDASSAIEVIQETEETEKSAFLEPEQSYKLDLNGDGQTETFFYTTETAGDEDAGEWMARMELFVNEQPISVFSGMMGTYGWKLYQAETTGGKTYLVAVSGSDNDWSADVWVLEWKDEDAFTILGDLGNLSRISEENGIEFLTGWARVSQVLLPEEEETNTITLSWMDALKSTGNIYIPLTYEIHEKESALKIVLKDPPYFLDKEKQWTAVVEFELFSEPGSEEKTGVVKAGEKVRLTAVTKKEGIFYLCCEKEDGVFGWFQDPEEIEFRGDGTYGYFEEAVFAG